ncbi:hypothetical protein OC846_001753 [Tilletia horrida]|uniref:Uncharacterized protein n=1 Tax=Tilletia horrida TaxID=155126 RepID=A0AAN6GVF4_9BASI|nr:hypothetical protein OC845_002838 [Tilletia horrida]KAK0555325.1 hypothetical protein OC846_001753 [Tilletia horrida]KAK0568525.1 hypothetical protein OC861_001855 [Tilletia horrida]
MKLAIATSFALIGASLAAVAEPLDTRAITQTKTLNATLRCDFLVTTGANFNNRTFALDATVQLPQSVDAGQPFNLTASFRLTNELSYIRTLLHALGGRTLGGVVSKLVVNAAGSNPASINAAAKKPITITNVTLDAGSSLPVLSFPLKGKVLSVGPFSATSSKPVVFSFGDMIANLTLWNETTKLDYPYNIYCPPQTRLTTIATVA